VPRGPKVSVCPKPGCPNLVPCQLHAQKPWRDREARRPPTPRGRAERVLRRWKRICHVCGQAGATEADHVIALALGGADDEANMRPIHPAPCHREKTMAEAAEARRRLAP
jgi:5-methylcytosine-specific restriction endonuclease McrA